MGGYQKCDINFVKWEKRIRALVSQDYVTSLAVLCAKHRPPCSH